MTKYKAIKINGIKKDYHRHIVEENIGRKLERNEVIHHINGDPRDNRLENLQIMSLSEHTHMHQAGRKEPDWVREAKSQRLKGRPNKKDRLLSEEEVAYIKEHYEPENSEFGVRALARKFNISHASISRIVNGKSYKTF